MSKENCYIKVKKITSSFSRELIFSALKKSSDINVSISVAVVDNGGNLIEFSRHDSAGFLTVNIAINKAWTASSFKTPTHYWNELIKTPQLAPLINTDRFVPIGGGHPIFLGDTVIGAIGVSGGNADEDQRIAEYAIKSMGLNIMEDMPTMAMKN